jgi:hypothetical protein
VLGKRANRRGGITSFDTIRNQLEEGQRRYAFDNSGLVKVDAIFDPHRPYQTKLFSITYHRPF